MRILAAVDKFRGTLTAAEVAAAIGVGARRAGHECLSLPLADGGEGTLEALGGANRWHTVEGPDGEKRQAAWRLEGDLAVIEMAQASGMPAVDGSNDPVTATTRGTGQLIEAALDAGAKTLIVGVGGSATTDGGLGALQVLEFRQFDAEVTVACDVATKFLLAAEVFAPQKGATPQQVAVLESQLKQLAKRYREELGVDVTEIPGSGAAGGLAGGLAALGARLLDGFALVADRVGLDQALQTSDLVITGEGRFDQTSLEGKVVGGVLRRAEAAGVPALVVAGEVVVSHSATVSLLEECGDQALSDTAHCLAEVVEGLL